ncbi:penicillin acylase family protein [Thalassotalea atypica]|uniref:penicillin acylase family protein n=1 Tax=Thalassotalea atypica TaxID=2054316 RepID=UPI002573E531|nr:penicillin acylase family protein [Thalassotalea atypica]
MKINRSVIFTLLSITIFIAATAATWIYSRIDSSLPILDGKKTVFGLSAQTVIERDASGVPTITAKNRADIAVALGFVHAQERFFQMDLLRRNSAGELSSLFGDIALDYDKEIRVHRFRERARAIVKQMSKEEELLLKAYTRGVNQGLDYLKFAPFEYLLLSQEPVPWQEEDTVLTVLSMYLDLQYAQGEREQTLGIMAKTLSDEVFSFLNPKGSQWDAAIDGTEFSPTSLPEGEWPTSLLRKIQTTNTPEKSTKIAQEQFVGSNNWAVSGHISTTGSAIVANDMHLGIRVPNTWFKARLLYRQGEEDVDVVGVTLPGTPNIIVGSNTNIAWGFTNSYGDWSDVIVLKTNKDNSQYLTPQGYKDFEHFKQIIAVKDKKSVEIDVMETIWGPVIGKDGDGNLLAYRWVAHDLRAVNLAVLELETAKNVDQAFEIASRSGIPAQNLMVGDKDGNIGWTIMGGIPNKYGNVGELPQDWSTGANGWDGYVEFESYPKVKNPIDHRLWTANSRVVGGEMLRTVGNGGYAIGARSQQIRDRLFESDQFNEQKLLNIALDTEAIFMKRWQAFLNKKVLTPTAIAQNPQWQEVATLLKDESLSAEVHSVAYRVVRNFRLHVRNITFEPLIEQLTAQDENFDFHTIRNQLETPLWQMINEQPTNYQWLSRESWSIIFIEALENTLMEMTDNQPLSQASWGQENQADIRHPLASSIPLFGHYLNMPAEPLPGDGFMPRVDGGSFGASERMIVSPGHEEQAILHMPTSQAGHPWSPYFGVGHSDWVKGKPSPLLPGETKYTLTLLSY